MANITGSLTADVIIPGAEINGTIPDLTVDNIIDGQTGDDIIAAAEGNDSIVGALGNDMLFGNVGIDTLDGGDGDDSLFGGKDDDSLIGGAGNDYLHGDLGVDVVYGGEGNDAIGSNSGNDTLYGGAGNDTFFGGKDQDVIYGEAGDDLISGDIGSDIVYGGAGKDTFIMGRNANGSTTGGALTADADQIMDFVSGEDKIQLTADQTFDELTFVKDQGNTIIQDKVTSEFLAVIEGVTDIDATDFKSETATPGDAGIIQFSSAEYSGKEADAGSASPNRVTITVVRSGGSSGAVTVSYNTAAGVNNPAEAATDYTEVSNGVLSWGDGETGPKTFEVLLPSDGDVNVFEDSETFSLLLQSPTNGAVLGDIQAAVVTINDGAAADLGAEPKLIGAELLVADAAGSFIGQVTSTTAKSYSIKGAISDGGATVENPITVDASGKLVLTAAGATALNSVKYLDVTIATDLGAESTIRVYGNVDNAIKDSMIGDVLDISDGTGQNAIKVGAGIYAEAVNVNKEVKLLGTSAKIPGVAPRTAESELTGLMTIASGASNAKVDGFKFSNTGRINVSAIIDKLAIENNIFSKQSQSAITANVAATNMTIKANLSEEATAIPINLTGVSTVNITQNTIKNVRGSGTTIDGISLTNPVLGATISSNTIENVTAGRGIDVSVNATPGAVLLSRNTISNTNQSGIFATNTVAITAATNTISLTGNKVSSGNSANVAPTATTGEAGIALVPLVGNTLVNAFSVTGNDITTSNTAGLLIQSTAAIPLNTILATGNNVAGNDSASNVPGGVGIRFITAAANANALDFKNNYYGVATPNFNTSVATSATSTSNIAVDVTAATPLPTLSSPADGIDFSAAALAPFSI